MARVDSMIHELQRDVLEAGLLEQAALQAALPAHQAFGPTGTLVTLWLPNSKLP
jgi:hypothetical protein